MPAFSNRSRAPISKKDVKPMISSLNCEPTHLNPLPGANLSSYPTTDLLGNNNVQVKSEDKDGAMLESPPRMTIDGTCAPPRVFHTSFFYLPRTPSTSPPTSPPKIFRARMSTGGRAPPKVDSSHKNVLASPRQEPTYISSSVAENITPRKTSDAKSNPKESVRNDSHTTVVTVKKPRGRPKKIKKSVGTPRKVSVSQSVGMSQSGTARSRGRPKKSLVNNMPESRANFALGRPKQSSSLSESSKKRSRGRPRKNLATIPEDQMKRPRGRPKGSVKKRGRPLPQVRAGCSDLMTAALTSTQLLSSRRATKGADFSTEVSRSMRHASGILTSFKERRPVGRPRKTVSVDEGGAGGNKTMLNRSHQ